jgi:DNA repair exonuclease SbcCD ATPase subunit
MIIFRKIKWKNFLSTGNHFTEIQLDNASNTLVVGSNGAGKSTVLDALCFVLFGKPFRSVNKPQLMNSINNKDCVVEIEFNVGNKSFRIVRGIKPNLFEIYQDGTLLNQDAASRDYQEHLEKFILKLNYKSFTQIVILGSASFTPFMQLSAADRRAIIEELLDIQIFSAMNNIIKEKLTINKDSIATKKHEIDLAQQKYDLQKLHTDEVDQNNAEKAIQYDEAIQLTYGEIQEIHANTATTTSKIEESLQLVINKSQVETKLDRKSVV